MRLALTVIILLSLGSIVSAAYRTKTVENPMGYAHAVSHAFSKGDFDDASGWRECTSADSDPRGTVILCEGTRSISYQVGKRLDVNYYCEFTFQRRGPDRFDVESEICE